MKAVIQKNMKIFKKKRVDTLILGSTHYEHIRPQIQKVLGEKVYIIDQAEIVADKLKEYLKRHPDVEKLCKRGKQRKFFTTTDPESFWRVGKKMASMDKKDVQSAIINI